VKEVLERDKLSIHGDQEIFNIRTGINDFLGIMRDDFHLPIPIHEIDRGSSTENPTNLRGQQGFRKTRKSRQNTFSHRQHKFIGQGRRRPTVNPLIEFGLIYEILDFLQYGDFATFLRP
jgi:hypothetical protein